MEYSHPALENIATLKDRFSQGRAEQQSLDAINAWERELNDLVSRETLAENPAMIATIAEYRKIVEADRGVLATRYSKDLPDGDRDRLLDKISLYEHFCARFDIKLISAEIQRVDKSIREELDALQ